MVKPKNSHRNTSGYNPQHQQNMDKINLPPQISCCICRELYPPNSYSSGQMQALRKVIHAHGLKALEDQKIAKCFSCSSGQSVERRCRICRHWKAVDLFSRSQRNLDMPICRHCQDYFQKEKADDVRLLTDGKEAAELPWGESSDASSRTLQNSTEKATVDEQELIVQPKTKSEWKKVQSYYPPEEEQSLIPFVNDALHENLDEGKSGLRVLDSWDYL